MSFTVISSTLPITAHSGEYQTRLRRLLRRNEQQLLVIYTQRKDGAVDIRLCLQIGWEEMYERSVGS